MVDTRPSPLWNVANGVITALAAVIAFFGTQLWSQGQRIAELISDSNAHHEQDVKVGAQIGKIDERQEHNTRDIAILSGQNSTQDSELAGLSSRLDKQRELFDAADARIVRQLDLTASDKDVTRLEKEISATVEAQAGSIQAEIVRLSKEVDRLNAELDRLKNPPH